jgi:hypothetical protein
MRLPSFRTALVWGALLRLALLPFPGFRDDVSAFERWALALARGGPRAIYYDPSVHPPVDYVPGYLSILWMLGKAHDWIAGPASDAGGWAFRVAVKAPGAIADLVLAWIVYRIARGIAKEGAGRAAAAIVLFAPPFWLVSAYWGQVDSVAAVPFALALWCAVDERPVLAWVALAVALSIKPQAAAFVPVLVAWQFRTLGSRALVAIAAGALAGFGIAYFIALPFAPVSGFVAVLTWLEGRYLVAVAKVPFATVSAFNLYSIGWQPFHSDATPVLGVPVRWLGLAITLLLVCAVALAVRRRPQSLVVAAAAALAVPYAFATRMHERYLFPSLTALAVAAAIDGTCGWIAAGLYATFTLDVLAILAGLQSGGHHPIALIGVKVASILNVVLVLALVLRARSMPAGK